MDAVLLALCSAALFGAMTVSLRPGLAQSPRAGLGALWTVLPALVVALTAAVIRFDWDVSGLWPFALAGLLGPGLSQTLFTLAVRDAGPARASVTVGTAPLFAVAIALVFLDEVVVAAVLLGAVLIVAGGLLLVAERDRPTHVKRIGIAFALASTLIFAVRDNFLRWLAVDTDVSPQLAAAVTLGTGAVAIACWVLVSERRISRRWISTGTWQLFVLPGILFGASYVCLFEAYYRGPVTVVSPLVATESLWGVLFSALFLQRVEVVGKRLLVGAALIVGGGVLIGIFR